MSSRPIRRAIAAAVLAVLIAPVAADPQASSSVPAGLIVPPGAPATVTSCRFGQLTILGLASTLVVANRTKHTLTGADVAYTAYDTEGSKISEETKHLNIGDSGVISGDTAVQNSSFDIDLRNVGNHLNLVGKIGCEIVAATFTGNRKWQVGEKWAEPIVPVQTQQMTMESDGGAGAPRSAIQVPAAPRLALAVTNAWNDTFQGALLIHDTVTITGGDADVQVRPTDFVLTMQLTGGAKKQYLGMPAAAPTYQKINPLGSQTSTAYEVQPASDLGRLGAITVPAHASVTTTVTFIVPDPVAVATDNRGVTAR